MLKIDSCDSSLLSFLDTFLEKRTFYPKMYYFPLKNHLIYPIILREGEMIFQENFPDNKASTNLSPVSTTYITAWHS